MEILGISAFYHDAAAALLVDGEIAAAAQEERFSREKYDPSFPARAIGFCLDRAGVRIDDLDAVVFYEKPFLKFERLLETYYAFAPRGRASFTSAIPVWIKEKLFQKRTLREGLADVQDYEEDELNLLFSKHHLSHAASAFYPSPFEEAAVLTLDAVGEWATAAISRADHDGIEALRELRFPHSLGMLYSSATYYLGFRVNSGEYKVMGLAPYGDPDSERVERFRRTLLEEVVDLKQDGSLCLDQDCFDYATGLRMVPEERWEELFGFPRREPESELEQIHCDLAYAVQGITEDAVFRMAQTARELTGSDHLCMAGGVALNCVANGKIRRTGPFEDIWVQPAAGDAGGALGAAYAVHYQYFGEKLAPRADRYDRMKGSYLGPEYSRLDVERTARRFEAPHDTYEDFEELCEVAAGHLDDGDVVGWFQGRMEWGPRALGNRSILGDPRSGETQEILNRKIKDRESFRPFAPSVLYEDVEDYLDLRDPSPYMLFVAEILEDRREDLPDDYHSRSLREKLYYERSDVPAVTHLDFTARHQTVHEDTNPRFHRLLRAFKELTGYGILVNTSFNVRGEPIVCSPGEAYRCFMRTDMDLLVVEDCLFRKDAQPEWHETKEEWRARVGLD